MVEIRFPQVSHLFKDKHQLLQSHRGWDPGALLLAEKIVARNHCPFVFEKNSRLVVDQNRSFDKQSGAFRNYRISF